MGTSYFPTTPTLSTDEMIWLGRPASLLACCLLWPLAASATANPPDTCLRSCTNPIARLRFHDTPAPAAPLCQSRIALQSTLLCVAVYCDKSARDADWDALNDMCLAEGASAIPSWSSVSNYTAGDIERLRHVQLHEEFPPDHVFRDAVVPSSALQHAWFDTLVSRACASFWPVLDRWRDANIILRFVECV